MQVQLSKSFRSFVASSLQIRYRTSRHLVVPTSSHETGKKPFQSGMTGMTDAFSACSGFLTSPNTRVVQENLRSFTTHDSGIDEKDVDAILQQRIHQMQCHSSGPVKKVFQLAKKILQGPVNDITRDRKILVLDAASRPAHVGVLLAQEFPEVLVHIRNDFPEMVQLGLDKLGLRNVMTSGMNDLSEYEDGTFDLIVTCFGLDVRL